MPRGLGVIAAVLLAAACGDEPERTLGGGAYDAQSAATLAAEAAEAMCGAVDRCNGASFPDCRDAMAHAFEQQLTCDRLSVVGRTAFRACVEHYRVVECGQLPEPSVCNAFSEAASACPVDHAPRCEETFERSRSSGKCRHEIDCPGRPRLTAQCQNSEAGVACVCNHGTRTVDLVVPDVRCEEPTHRLPVGIFLACWEET